MASADSVTLACGCVVVAGDDGARLTPVCQEHTADPRELALVASQDPVVQALASATGPVGAPAAFSYSGQPNKSALDKVRFTIADTRADNPLFTDGEILSVLEDSRNDWLTTSLVLLDALVARYAGACDESVGSVSIAYSQKADGYRRLSDTLRARLGKRGVPYAGGIDRFDKRSMALDPTRVQPMFTRTMFTSLQRPFDTRYLGRGEYFVQWGGYLGALTE